MIGTPTNMADFFLVSLVLFVVLNCAVAKKDPKIVCYYTNWSQYRPGYGQFFPENIDANLCTHVIFSFAKVSKDGEISPYEWNDPSTPWSKGLYERTIDLKNQNPDLKVLLAVGGWNHGSLAFSQMVNNQVARRNFVYNSVEFLKNHSFSGLDLDWEYPANRDSKNVKDKQFFTVLVQELSKAFKPHGLLLTAAVGAGKPVIDTAYEISKISRYLSFINLMTYDLHGAWENITGINAPLYARESDEDKTLNVAWAADYYTKNGAPAEKLIIGLGAYGRSFKLVDPKKHDIGANATGAGNKGPFTITEGFLAYYEICENLEKGWKRGWDNESKVPYAYSEDQWVGYDDVESLKEKAKFILSKEYGGAMFWAIDLDDFKGTKCNQGPYPLINAVKDVLTKPKNEIIHANLEATVKSKNKTKSSEQPSSKKDVKADSVQILSQNGYYVNQVVLPVETSLPSLNPIKSNVNTQTSVKYEPKPAAPIKQTPQAPPLRTQTVECSRGEGYYADKSTGCRGFYRCVAAGSAFLIHQHTCPANLLFDESISTCNYPNLVNCF